MARLALCLFFPLLSIAFSSASSPFLVLPDQTEIRLTYIFKDAAAWKKGLSGVVSRDFGSGDGAFFIFPKRGLRSFWMPDTHFDLDIIFLDKNLAVTHIQRDVPHHPSKKGSIPRVPPRWAHYVLEIKSQTKMARKLKKGMRLRFKGKGSLLEIRSNIRL